MREHEVPTHVQAEDKVLLWFTFPQVVAITAVGALAYGIYNYAPLPSSEVRIALAAVFALVGLAMIAGRVGGRRLPLVAADLLQFRLGGRCYAGTPAELVRSEPPAPLNDSPGLIQHMAQKTQRRLRRLRRGLKARRVRRSRERRNGRRALRPQRWFRKRKPRDQGNGGNLHAVMRRSALLASLALVALVGTAASGTPDPTPQPPTPEPTPGPGTPYPQTSPDRWRNEIDFDPPDPVSGRRLYVEALAVFEDRATVTLRAATEVDLQVQAFGGPQGQELHFYSGARVKAGESIFYTLPLSGDAPSFTFAWVDTLGQAGAVSLKGEQIPHPLPVAEGELCDVGVTSIRWSPGALTGTLGAAECTSSIEHPIDLVIVDGYTYIEGPMLMKTRVTDVYGSVTAASGESSATVELDPPGSAAFQLPVPVGEAVHELSIEAALEAHLRGSAPPKVTLELIPAREEFRLVPVKVWRPGASEVVSETVTVQHDDGATSQHEVSARLVVPSKEITVVPTVLIKHEEYILAMVSPRGSAYGSREETVQMALTIGSDALYRPFVPPPVEATPTPPVQTPITEDGGKGLFSIFGWEWPW